MLVVVGMLGSVVAVGWPEAPAGEHRFLEKSASGAPDRWNPCQPIHYQVNLSSAPAGAMADVQEAVQRVSEATGISFVFDGTTRRTADQQVGTAFQTTMPGQPRWLPLLITWVPHEHFDFLVDTPQAVAFGTPFNGDGQLADEYVSGVVAVDAGQRLPPGFSQRYSRGVVLMHELGHVMGLAHVASGHELMWSPSVRSASLTPDLTETDWGPGDLAGLKLLGRSSGCLLPR